MEDDPTYFDAQKQLYKDRLEDLKIKEQAYKSQNIKNLQTQVARIKQTIEKVLHHDVSLTEIICILFCEQVIIMASVLTVLSTTIATIVLAIKDIFGGRGSAISGSAKD